MSLPQLLPSLGAPYSGGMAAGLAHSTSATALAGMGVGAGVGGSSVPLAAGSVGMSGMSPMPLPAPPPMMWPSPALQHAWTVGPMGTPIAMPYAPYAIEPAPPQPPGPQSHCYFGGNPHMPPPAFAGVYMHSQPAPPAAAASQQGARDVPVPPLRAGEQGEPELQSQGPLHSIAHAPADAAEAGNGAAWSSPQHDSEATINVLERSPTVPPAAKSGGSAMTPISSGNTSLPPTLPPVPPMPRGLVAGHRPIKAAAGGRRGSLVGRPQPYTPTSILAAAEEGGLGGTEDSGALSPTARVAHHLPGSAVAPCSGAAAPVGDGDQLGGGAYAQGPVLPPGGYVNGEVVGSANGAACVGATTSVAPATGAPNAARPAAMLPPVTTSSFMPPEAVNLKALAELARANDGAAIRAAEDGAGFRGVRRKQGPGGLWRAEISLNGAMQHLGLHPSAVEAAVAYDLAACKREGSNDITNFSIDRYDAEGLSAISWDDLITWICNQPSREVTSSDDFKGIFKDSKRWRAQIRARPEGAPDKAPTKRMHLGCYSDKALAARAYDLGAIKRDGLLRASTNFPKAHYSIVADRLGAVRWRDISKLTPLVLPHLMQAPASALASGATPTPAVDAQRTGFKKPPPHTLSVPPLPLPSAVDASALAPVTPVLPAGHSQTQQQAHDGSTVGVWGQQAPSLVVPQTQHTSPVKPLVPAHMRKKPPPPPPRPHKRARTCA